MTDRELLELAAKAGIGWPQERIDNPPEGTHLFNIRACISKAKEALK